MSRYKKLGMNIALLSLGNMASKILSFLLIPLYTAVLTTTEYGTADLMTTTANLIMPFFTLLIGEAIVRFALDAHCDKSAVFTSAIPILVGGLCLFFFFSPLVCLIDELVSYYWYFVVFYVSVVLVAVLGGFIRGIEKIVIYSLGGIIHTALFLVLNITLLVVFKVGLQGYLLAMILSNVGTIVFYIAKGKLYAYFEPSKFDILLLKKML